jgi:hypothetical protein
MPVPDFSPGEVLTAAAMDSIGRWLVKTVTVGATVTTVPVTDAFSTEYDNYEIVFSGGSKSVAGTMNLQFGATGAGYYNTWYGRDYLNNAVQNAASNAATTSVGVEGTTNGMDATWFVNSPFLTRRTTYRGVTNSIQVGGYSYSFGGFVDNATSYTAFTLLVGTGTLTGGTIRVYGYRN